MFIDNFWRELFPMFINNFEIVYIYLDILTILVFLRITAYLPSVAIGVRSKL